MKSLELIEESMRYLYGWMLINDLKPDDWEIDSIQIIKKTSENEQAKEFGEINGWTLKQLKEYLEIASFCNIAVNNDKIGYQVSYTLMLIKRENKIYFLGYSDDTGFTQIGERK